MNKELAGPLLKDGPVKDCNTKYFDEASGVDQELESRVPLQPIQYFVNTTAGTACHATLALFDNLQKGPLLAIALALFGRGSFLDTVASNVTKDQLSTEHLGSADIRCSQMLLLAGLLHFNSLVTPTRLPLCISGRGSRRE